MAAGEGSVWVGNLVDQTVTKIDPRRRYGCRSGLARQPNADWTCRRRGRRLGGTRSTRGSLARRAGFNRVTQTIPTPDGRRPEASQSARATCGRSTASRRSRGSSPSLPRRGSALAGRTPTAVAVGGGSVWVANAGDATVQRFDPNTFEEGPIRTISVGARPAAMAYGEGALWVANRGDDTVTRIDPSTHATLDIRVGDEPAGVAVGADAVWVTNRGDGSVSRIDPTTNEVVRVDRGWERARGSRGLGRADLGCRAGAVAVYSRQTAARSKGLVMQPTRRDTSVGSFR